MGHWDSGPFFFIFMQFLAKILSNNKLVLPGLAPCVWDILDQPMSCLIFSKYHLKLTEILIMITSSVVKIKDSKSKREKSFYRWLLRF